MELSSITSAELSGFSTSTETLGDVLGEYLENETQEDIDNRNRLATEYEATELNLTQEQQDFIDTKLSSKLWRLDNLYTIRDKDGIKMILKLNASQKKILKKFKHKRKIILKSRQQGISTLYLAYYLDDCLFKPGFQAGIQSYGQDEADKLAKRALLMWDELDPNIKELLNIRLISNNSKGLTFSNGSILKIGNFRGDTLQGLHVSELGKIAKKYPEKAKELKTGAFQAVGKNNKITIESTAEGRTGLFYELWVRAKMLADKGLELGPFDFEAIFLSWVEDPDCNINKAYDIDKEYEEYFRKVEKWIGAKLEPTQKWWYVSKAIELGDDMKQEYPTTPEEAFEQSVEGTYYREQYKKLKLYKDTYDRNLKVHRAVDLGMNDTFSIGFFQIHSNGDVKIIAEYQNSGHGLEFYKDVCNTIAKKLGWQFGITYVPHDVKVKELIADKTRWDAMVEMGFKPILVKKHGLLDGIQETRKFLEKVQIDERCEAIVLAIQNYRKKYDKQLGVFLSSPVHDDHSHPADMIRYMAMGLKHYTPVNNEVYTRRRNSRNFNNDYAV